ncbi:hypothetical protein NC652_016927 [Populus alba x Populus x berolinensis]|uniref:Uncharacterized protein n=1 Tax=Populus alba x Populus x berolinensis TaxID=444605 RepID=A0AAD6QNV4_9ROSI|nr:hypothetical protein NC652_016927 [Populus alba x Populus x berolinensis]KAJ6993869.1 hypothetical protein NC653_016865 [Populus alba x Populus x berolinensis]
METRATADFYVVNLGLLQGSKRSYIVHLSFEKEPKQDIPRYS